MERQLVSILVGVGVGLIIYGFNQISERIANNKNKKAPARMLPAGLQAQLRARTMTPVAMPKQEKAVMPDMPGDYKSPRPAKAAVKESVQRRTAPPRQATTPRKEQHPQMSLRQAVIWSEILRRKF